MKIRILYFYDYIEFWQLIMITEEEINYLDKNTFFNLRTKNVT